MTKHIFLRIYRTNPFDLLKPENQFPDSHPLSFYSYCKIQLTHIGMWKDVKNKYDTLKKEDGYSWIRFSLECNIPAGTYPETEWKSIFEWWWLEYLKKLSKFGFSGGFGIGSITLEKEWRHKIVSHKISDYKEQYKEKSGEVAKCTDEIKKLRADNSRKFEEIRILEQCNERLHEENAELQKAQLEIEYGRMLGSDNVSQAPSPTKPPLKRRKKVNNDLDRDDL